MLHIKNITRDSVVVDRGRIADNFWARLVGLIGVKELPMGDGLLIDPCKGVHCLFMSIPIDVLHVDSEDRVIGLTAEMKPWRVGRVFPTSRYVVELPAGTIAYTDTRVGDRLRIEIDW